MPPIPKATELAPRVVKWFLSNARDLPWRHTLDPYAIWVSEIMLQQTQVKTVIPFWNRWMKRLPTVAKLARAKESTILKLWEGLGYYRRCRNLQKGAHQIMARHEGEFPSGHKEIQKLTGIGRYTAGAIASIAFNQARPILDGNVIRVLTRLHGIEGDPKSKAINDALWSLAADYVSNCGRGAAKAKSVTFAGKRSALNQGLMELGATVCQPTQPNCEECPLSDACMAKATDRINELPYRSPRATTTSREFTTIVLADGGRYLIRRRPKGVINEGFWEFPNLETTESKAKPAEVCRELFSIRAKPIRIDRFEHSVTRYRFRQTVYRVNLEGNTRPKGDWLTLAELRKRPFFSPQIRIFDSLG
ncbi:MAG: A/G-specific adenine glycosylase [Limisphaerales bacterium]